MSPAVGRPAPGARLDAGHRAQHLGVAQRAVADGQHGPVGAELAQRLGQRRRREQPRRHAAPPWLRRDSMLVHGREDLAPPGVDARQHQAAVARRGSAAARMSRLVAPTTPMPSAWASPLAAATPTRSPVKRPGPTSTATTSRSAGVRPTCARRCSSAGVSVSTWRRRPVSVNSASTPAAVRTATPDGLGRRLDGHDVTRRPGPPSRRADRFEGRGHLGRPAAPTCRDR